ncbi:MAG: HEAT repeat domain-containing protein [Chloroflexota bacterium]
MILSDAESRKATSRSLVILGDPGSGKTTLIRWLATAFLLKLKNEHDWRELPDVKTLPEKFFLPILIRCRDLPEHCLSGTLKDILYYVFRKIEIDEDKIEIMYNLSRQKLESGDALLLIDGLDEVLNPQLRLHFCEQIEYIKSAYPNASIIVTSRIVGYREMRRRIGKGFEHFMMSDFSSEDKDEFARRWCKIVESPERQAVVTEEFISDIHSSERIEWLTRTPILLTTMALVKRKIGKLPSKRTQLYAEALDVLLNWRKVVDAPMDRDEVFPQLSYIAYVMCQHGVQQLRRDEIITLLKQMRKEYPDLSDDVQNHTPKVFVQRLERQTRILSKVGHVEYKGQLEDVFEFRHLTFQEYFAALAIVRGYFPNCSKKLSLAEHIVPLASQTIEVITKSWHKEQIVDENWSEVIRLCITLCEKDDVDEVLRTILAPPSDADKKWIVRPRAIFAALCLADEPNVSRDVAIDILQSFVLHIEEDYQRKSINHSAEALSHSYWHEELRINLVKEFCRRRFDDRYHPASLCCKLHASSLPTTEPQITEWIVIQIRRLKSDKLIDIVDGALGIIQLVKSRDVQSSLQAADMVEDLLHIIQVGGPVAHVGAWALDVLHDEDVWRPSPRELDILIQHCRNFETDAEALYWIIGILCHEQEQRLVEPLLKRLNCFYTRLQKRTIYSLGRLRNTKAVKPLIALLNDPDINDPDINEPDNKVIQLVIEALGEIGDKEAVEPLMARLMDEKGKRRYKTCFDELVSALGHIGDPRPVELLISLLDDGRNPYRVARALGDIGDKRAIEPLMRILQDQERSIEWYMVGRSLVLLGRSDALEIMWKRLFSDRSEIRRNALKTLAMAYRDDIECQLLSVLFIDRGGTFWDPQEEINQTRIQEAAHWMHLPEDDVRRRYEALAQRFSLKLSWQNHNNVDSDLIGNIRSQTKPDSSLPSRNQDDTSQSVRQIEGQSTQSEPSSAIPNDNESEIDHLRELLSHRHNNRRKLEMKVAVYAKGEEPLHLQNQFEAEKEEIEKIETEIYNLSGAIQ